MGDFYRVSGIRVSWQQWVGVAISRSGAGTISGTGSIGRSGVYRTGGPQMGIICLASYRNWKRLMKDFMVKYMSNLHTICREIAEKIKLLLF